MAALTDRSAVDLGGAIRSRELTSAEVVEAHIERLRATHPQINAVVADRYDAAIADARACDQRIAQSALRRESAGDLPLLYGVPFTVKESIALQGMPHTAGVAVRKGKTATQNATIVQRLIEAGGIPLGVTNVSELTLWIESENPVYGRTNNPFDTRRTAGGSSGGEGAAIAVGGAPFGIGADIGGSIRTPALFCGVFGHKPSPGLLSTSGIWPTVTGAAEAMLTPGPLARRAEDLMPLLRVMSGSRGGAALRDPGRVSLDGLQITLIEGTTRLPVSRELREARARAAGALASAGARVRTLNLPGLRDSLLPYLHLLQDDGVSDGRPTRALLRNAGDGAALRDLLFGRAGHTLPTRLTLLAEQVGHMVATPSITARLAAKAQAVIDELIDAIGDGVLLHPAHPTVAPRHRRTYGRPWVMMPAALFNMAGVPVTEVPLGLNARGLPLGVQVAAAPGADHLTIAIALELEAVFGGWSAPPAI